MKYLELDIPADYIFILKRIKTVNGVTIPSSSNFMNCLIFDPQNCPKWPSRRSHMGHILTEKFVFLGHLLTIIAEILPNVDILRRKTMLKNFLNYSIASLKKSRKCFFYSQNDHIWLIKTVKSRPNFNWISGFSGLFISL